MHGSPQRRLFAGLCLLLLWQSGCAAFRPVHGVPARYLPEDMKSGLRSGRKTIDLSLLRQPPPRAHLIDSGDVLGIYIEGFVGKPTDPPPVHFPLNNEAAPSFGLPYPVREDGTISLPVVGSIPVRGLTLVQAEERVKQAYLAPRQLIRPDFNRVQVNLQRPRQFRVLVIRQDSRNDMASTLGQINMGVIRRGTGKIVNLPAYSNDVLNALTATEGLPGLDAENAVYVIRHRGNTAAGGDPRWPVNVDPSILVHPSAATDSIIRGQSPEGSDSANQQADVRYAHYYGPPSPPVQFVGGQAPPAPGLPGVPGLPGAPGSDPSWDPRGALPPSPSAGPSGWTGHSQQPFPGSSAPIVDPRLQTNPAPDAIPNPWQAPSGYGQSQNVPQQPYQQQPYYPQQPYSPQQPGYAPQSGPGASTMYQPDNQVELFPGRDPAHGSPGLSGPPGSMPPGAVPHGMVPPGSMPSGFMTPGSGLTPTPDLMPQPEFPTSGSLETGHGVLGSGTLEGRHVVRIPIRLGPGETADIRPEDIILYDGDIVFIESRDTEVFYTGGLLGGGQYTLPRDYDLDILQALSLATARGPTGTSRAVGGVSALNNDVSISPSTAIVLRKLPDGGEVPVKIDLYRARTDLSERIVIQPGDFILLQYTPLEAVAAFFERHLLETALFAVATQSFNRNGN